jgi:hypothetical protein
MVRAAKSSHEAKISSTVARSIGYGRCTQEAYSNCIRNYFDYLLQDNHYEPVANAIIAKCTFFSLSLQDRDA